MKKHRILNFALAITFLSFIAGYAQEETPVKSLLKSYIEASNQLDETKDINKVLSLFGSNYKNNRSYVGLSGLVKNTTIDYDKFSEHLTENLKNKNYNFKMSIEKVIYEYQNKNAGTIFAIVNFESKIEGKLAEKGTILMNLVASNALGSWKIVHNNTVRVSEAKDIGSCFCYLFSKGEVFFNAETYYPDGVEYEREYKSFRVSIKDGKRKIINRANDNKAFSWKENGDIYDKSIKVGTAETADKAIQTILTYIYSKSCTKINFG